MHHVYMEKVVWARGVRPCGPVPSILSCFAQLLRLFKIEDGSHAKLRVSVDVRLSQRMPMKKWVAVIKIAFLANVMVVWGNS